jgi:hypothetical protein
MNAGQPSVWSIVPFLIAAMALTFYSYKNDSDKWHWRRMQSSFVVAAGAMMYCHPVAGVIGAILPLSIPVIYFNVARTRQFSLLDMMQFVFFLGCVAGGAASQFKL